MPKPILDLPPRIPPHNLEAEEAVLGAVLHEGREVLPKLVTLLRPADFFTDAHRLIWGAMLALFEAGEPVDLVTLQEHLRRFGDLAPVGGPAALALLMERGAIAAHAASYAQIVRDFGMQREMIQVGSTIVTEAYEARAPVRDLIAASEAQIFRIAERSQESHPVEIQPLLEAAMQAIEARVGGGGGITGLAMGLEAVDEMTAGLQPSDLILIAGRPSNGKTALALSMVGHAGIRGGQKILLLSLEMGAGQLVQRLLAAEGRVDGQAIRRGDLRAEHWGRLVAASLRLQQTRILIDDAPAMTPLDVRAKARQMQTQHGLDLVVIDYLQLMRGSDPKANRQQEVSEISRSLKLLARELGVPVVALSQLSRAIEHRGDNTPRLSDLRESGSLEQDADVVLFVHRPSLYDPDLPLEARNTAEIHVGKQRNGPVGKVEVAYLARYTRFDNLSSLGEHEPAP